MSTSTLIRSPGIAVRSVAAVAAAAVIAIGLDAAIAAIARAGGVPRGFKPLDFSSYASLTILGVLVGAAAWSLIRARSNRSRSVMRRLVPAVVVISLVPDLALGLGQSMAHTTWGGIAALIAMHLVVAAAAVTTFSLAMPLRD